MPGKETRESKASSISDDYLTLFSQGICAESSQAPPLCISHIYLGKDESHTRAGWSWSVSHGT